MPSPWPATAPTETHRAAYADAIPRPYWLDTLPARAPHPPLEEAIDADLCIVGGGYTGLWAALYAKALDPARDVVLLEATRCGNGASGRNGGFVQSSPTHGTSNGLSRFPDEIDRLERVGHENFSGLARDLADLGIDAEFETSGDLVVALEPRELADLAEEADLLRRFGYETECSTPRRPAPRSTRRCFSAGCGRARARRSSIPASSPTACARRRSAAASGSTSTPRSVSSAAGSPSSPTPESSRPAASCWPRAPIRRRSERSAATSRRSTTTRSSPSPSIWACSAGARARESATWATSSTTAA